MLYVPVNSNGHVGTLPPFCGTLTQHSPAQNVLHKQTNKAYAPRITCYRELGGSGNSEVNNEGKSGEGQYLSHFIFNLRPL